MPMYSSGVDHTYEMEQSIYQEALPAFQFQKRFAEIDWRRLSMVDVDRIVRELDFVALQENVATVTFCNIDAVPDIDPLVTKLFKLAQYTIEYLLHSQEYLQSVIGDLDTKLSISNKEQEVLKNTIDNNNAEMEKVKLESKRRRKIIQQQQLLIESGASSYYQCPHCEKAFMNASFLQGHLQRRHPGSTSYIGDVIEHSRMEQTKLGDHVKHLEADLINERLTFNEKLKQAEQEKLRWEEQSQREMSDWKREEEKRWRDQLEQMRETFLTDIKELKSKEQEYEKTIGGLQETMDKGHSNLGDLVDDYREEKVKLREYEGRMETLENINASKTEELEILSKEIRQLRKENQRNLHDHERKLAADQKKQMEDLKRQMRESKSRQEVGNLQKQLKKLTKKTEEKKQHVARQTNWEPPKSAPAPKHEEDDVVDSDFREAHRREAMKRDFLPIIQSLLDDNLRKCGVDPQASGISQTTLTNKLVVLKTERQQQAKSAPHYYQIRDHLKKDVEEQVRSTTGSKQSSKTSMVGKSRSSLTTKRSSGASVRSGGGVSSPTRKGVASPARGSIAAPSAGDILRHNTSTPRKKQASPSKQQQQQPASKQEPKAQQQQQGSKPTYADVTASRPSGAGVTSSPSSIKRKSPVTSAVQRKLLDDDDDLSPWDTDDSDDVIERAAQPSGLARTAPASGGQKKVEEDWDDDDDDDDVGDILASDDDLPPRKTGTMTPSQVRKLGGQISTQLTHRKPPPAGAVDVSPVVQPFDVSDDDSFHVSSLEEDSPKPRPAPRQTTPSSGGGRSSTVSNTGTSVWGSGQKPSKELEDLKLDDFSD